VWDIADVRCVRNSVIDMAVTFPHLLAGIRMLVTAVDSFLNRKTAAVCPPNLTRRLPENTDQARFVFWQRHAAELRQVNLCRLLV
jgi:hypothetical protein